MNNLTPVVKNILLINVVIFAIQSLAGYNFIDIFGLRHIQAETFQPWQFVTHMFIHASLRHLFFNMIGLFFFGPLLEQFWGSKKFLIFYMVTGLGAGMLYSGVNAYEAYQMRQSTISYIENPTPDHLVRYFREYDQLRYTQDRRMTRFITEFSDNPENKTYIRESIKYVSAAYTTKLNIPMVGASGAVFGILMGFGLLFPNTKLMLLFFPFPIKAKYLVGFYGLTAIFGAIHSAPGDNIAHYAHLGGMLFAWIMILIWRNDRNNFY
jgi:membrane associated rhomboid family serine protease